MKLRSVLVAFALAFSASSVQAGAILDYRLFGEVAGNSDALYLFPDINAGTPFGARLRIDSSNCATGFGAGLDCTDIAISLRFGDVMLEGIGHSMAILKDPPLGVYVQMDHPVPTLPSNALQTPMETGFTFLGDGVLGGDGEAPINASAFESGRFGYSFFYSLDGGDRWHGEVDLFADINRVHLVNEPPVPFILAVGLAGLTLIRLGAPRQAPSERPS